MSSIIQFQDLEGLQPYQLDRPLCWVGTGMACDYDLRRMSTAGGRRDFGNGISGSHTAFVPDTCFTELKISDPFPENSHLIRLTGSLKLLDIRHGSDDTSTFSGKYYSDDRQLSCDMIDANRGYLQSGGYQGILRFSKPILEQGKLHEVVALLPEAIGFLDVQSVEPLNPAYKPIQIIGLDGAKHPIELFMKPK